MKVAVEATFDQFVARSQIDAGRELELLKPDAVVAGGLQAELFHADKLAIVACDRNLFGRFRDYFGAGSPVHTMGTGVY